ncbi:MAG TPA: acetylglutamate kinase [Gemmatimonadaceae bacterium]|nr:acetylglutamate kinase [Gemmatimonadaceae bacterium]
MTTVVKVGGRAQSDPALPAAIAALWRERPGALCVVHGGGDEVSALQSRLGGVPEFVGGRRVTSEQDIETLRMALSGSANKRLVAALIALGVPAVGLSGEDGALLSARTARGGALGRVGDVTAVDARLLRHLMDGHYLPVLSPLSRDAAPSAGAAGALNVNADDAAAAVAAALGAVELLLISDVPGVLVGDGPASELDAGAARALVRNGTARGGMAAKLEAALAALERGVVRVRVGDVAAIGDRARGTAVVAAASAASVASLEVEAIEAIEATATEGVS